MKTIVVKTFIIKDLIETPNAILTEFGLKVFNIVKNEIESGNDVILSFEGIKNCNSHFLNASIGELFNCFGESLYCKLSLEEINNKLWESKIVEIISYILEPHQAKTYQEVLLSVLKD